MTQGSTDPRKTEALPDPRRSASSTTTKIATGTIIPAAPDPGSPSSPSDVISLGRTRYRILSTLSQSTGEAILYRVDAKGSQGVAKVYRLPAKTAKLRLLERIRKIRKKHLCEILAVGIEDERLIEVMPFASGGTLRDRKPFHDARALRSIILIVAQAIDALHAAGIVHCDVKPENILFMDDALDTPVLADFGIAEFLDRNGKATTEKRGSPLYAAPEAHAVAENMIRVYPASDWYSLGISILDVWAADTPFPAGSELDLLEAKLQGKVEPPADMPEDLRRLVSGLVFPLADNRWGYKEVQAWAAGAGPDVPHVATTPIVRGGNEPSPGTERPLAEPVVLTRKASAREKTPGAASVLRTAPSRTVSIDRRAGALLPVTLCVALSAAAALFAIWPFPSTLSGMNPFHVPLFIMVTTAAVWRLQRGQQGRLLSTLVAGPIGGIAAAIAAYWIASGTAGMPFLLPVCCMAAAGLMMVFGAPRRASRGLVISALGALLLTYLLHLPPLLALTRINAH